MKPVCYLGDDALDRAAVYLSGIMTHFEIPFEYVSSTESLPPDFEPDRYSLFILSDYPHKKFLETQLERIVESVEKGIGLLMIGGWESFHGQLGEYHESSLKSVLPVEMRNSDDRRNYSQPVLIRRKRMHPILDDLPWHTPAGIGGFNAFTPKKGMETLLESVRFDVKILGDNVTDCEQEGVCTIDGATLTAIASVEHESGDTFTFSPVSTQPLLVVGKHGNARTAALATDVAPHWVGGFVDWGTERLSQKLPNGCTIEVGNCYARFFRNLLLWAAGESF